MAGWCKSNSVEDFTVALTAFTSFSSIFFEFSDDDDQKKGIERCVNEKSNYKIIKRVD